MATEKTLDRVLLVDSHHGVYSWQLLAQALLNGSWEHTGVEKIDLEYIANKNNMEKDDYWDVVIDVENNIVITLATGEECTVHQDEDIWAIPAGYEWPED